MAKEEQTVAKKMRLDDESDGESKRSVILKALAVLLETDKDAIETFALLAMLKRKRTRKYRLLKGLLTLEKEMEAESEDSYDDDDDDDDDNAPYQAEVKKDFLKDIVSKYTETQFVTCFRIGRSLYEKLCKSYAESASYKEQPIIERISAEKQIAVFLFFASKVETSYDSVAQRFDLDQTTVRNIIENTTMYLCSLAVETIKWPDNEQKLQSSKALHDLGFNKAIGCIGCTYISTPGPVNNGTDYIDKHGNFSLCIQGVCNEHRQFIDLYLSHVGSSHASWIYKHTRVCRELKELCGDYYLLGNSDYLGNENILVPYRNNHAYESMKGTFNRYLKEGHLLIKETFSLLKQRFGKLQYCRLENYKKISFFIQACCVIYNMAVNDELPVSYPPEDDCKCACWEEAEENEAELKANAVREEIAKEMFDNMDFE